MLFRSLDDFSNPLDLINKGVSLFEILAVSLQLDIPIDQLYDTIKAKVTVPQLYLQNSVEGPFPIQTLFFILKTLNPGAQTGRLQTETLKNGPYIKSILNRFGLVDAYDYILETNPDNIQKAMDIDFLNREVVSQKKYSSSEFQADATLIDKERKQLIQLLQSTLLSNIKYQSVQPDAYILALRILTHCYHFPVQEELITKELIALTNSVSHYQILDLLSPKVQKIVHHLFSPFPGITDSSLTFSDRVSTYLNECQFMFTREDLTKREVDGKLADLFLNLYRPTAHAHYLHSVKGISHLVSQLLPQTPPNKRSQLSQALDHSIKTKKSVLLQLFTIHNEFYGLLHLPESSPQFKAIFIRLFSEVTPSRKKLLQSIMYHKDQQEFSQEFQYLLKTKLTAAFPSLKQSLSLTVLSKQAAALAYEEKTQSKVYSNLFKTHVQLHENPQPKVLSNLINALSDPS